MQPGQLLVGGDRDLLQEVLLAAAAAPGTSVTASRLAAEALLALAAAGDEAPVAEVLGSRADHEVRTRDGSGAGAVSIAGLSGAEAVRCFAGTTPGAEDATVELVVHDGFGREQVLLARRGTEPPLLLLDDATRHRLALRRPLPAAGDDASVAALAEVLAHLPTRTDIAEAVQSALIETTVEVDIEGVQGAATALAGQLKRTDDALTGQIDALAVGLSRHLQRVNADVADAVRDAESRQGDQLSRSTASLTAALLVSEQRQVDQTAARLRDVTSAVERVVAANTGAASQRLHEQLVTTANRLASQLDAAAARLVEADEGAARRLDDLAERLAAIEAANDRLAAVEAGNRLLAQQLDDLRRALLGPSRGA